ncbi:hypothetical protein [Pseudooctadecabacter jejudonensis]|uniref:Uncharacterized protein n=1 Tax=Pseudooctadecabacter jejudonensis TaxID=1391910 RepID=A0A1Y5THS9_9RHOB|nr:hypothetical protein [Pseudooctadecabacter jejudonensis]SLN60632.1 hypothetical protein PSJ8397_03239 [Pseudooctadecabacter jejudonensis]
MTQETQAGSNPPAADRSRDPTLVPPKRVEFLDKPSYRQRRLRDAARVLPVFGAIMMVLPLMWPRDTADQSLTSSGLIYLFVLWAVLVALAFAVSRVLPGDRAGDVADNLDDAGAVRRRQGE